MGDGRSRAVLSSLGFDIGNIQNKPKHRVLHISVSGFELLSINYTFNKLQSPTVNMSKANEEYELQLFNFTVKELQESREYP